jgi:hypothetical protein
MAIKKIAHAWSAGGLPASCTKGAWSAAANPKNPNPQKKSARMERRRPAGIMHQRCMVRCGKPKEPKPPKEKRTYGAPAARRHHAPQVHEK